MEPIGDPLPKALAAYYEALDGGRADAVLACFSAEARLAMPDPVASVETDPRRIHSGLDEIARWLAARGRPDRSHVVDLCIDEGDVCLLEGTLVERGRETASFAASARLSTDGTIARYLAYVGRPAARPSVADVDGGRATAIADVVAVFDSYITALQDGRTDEAVEHFSADALYSHPPYLHRGDGSRLEFRGHDGLRAGFGYRGPSSFRHELVASAQRGPHAMVEGITVGLPEGRAPGGFVSTITLDDVGQICRYVSFYCEPAVP